MIDNQSQHFCKICHHPVEAFAAAKVLRKYSVTYYRCQHCGFIQTEAPYWLDEAYAQPIAAEDVGLVARNIQLAQRTRVILGTLFDSGGRFLDYGGGYGLFVRLMRDSGFDFFRYDKYTPGIFSRGFDVDRTGHYEVITAFEVFEHLVDPMSEFEQMLEISRNILFSTRLVPDPPPQLDEWWYYGVNGGQHIAFYTLKTLSVIAERFGLNLYSNGINLHLLTSCDFPKIIFRIVSSLKVGRLLGMFYRRPSLTLDDYHLIDSRDTVNPQMW